MQKELLVSISITTFNMEQYVARALESILMQKTNFDFEIVVGDDASTDNTLTIISEIANKNPGIIRVLKSERNKGLISNFVGTLMQSKGKYIATVDADDFWIDEYKLQKQVDFLENNECIGYIFTNYYQVDEKTKNRYVGVDDGFEIIDDAYSQIFTYWPLHISTFCFRKSLLDFNELHTFVKNNFEAQDLPLYISMALKCKGHYFSHYSTIVSMRENSMSNQLEFEKRMSNLLRCYEIGEYFNEKNPLDKKVIQRWRFRNYFKLLMEAWETKEYSNVVKYRSYLKASMFIKHNPKAFYIFLASHNETLFQLVKLWVLRKRKL